MMMIVLFIVLADTEGFAALLVMMKVVGVPLPQPNL
jgi:hypothetical protein